MRIWSIWNHLEHWETFKTIWDQVEAIWTIWTIIDYVGLLKIIFGSFRTILEQANNINCSKQFGRFVPLSINRA